MAKEVDTGIPPETNLLEASDEDFENMAPPEDAPQVEEEPSAEDPVEPSEESGDVPPEDEPPAEEEPPEDPSEPSEDSDQPLEPGDSVPPADDDQPAKEPKAEKEEPATTTEEEVAPQATAEQQLAQLFSPFRANGKQMQVGNIQDALSLMQMGANYNKKMAGLKPNLKLMKMLDNNDLLDEEKLSYLIDLNKKDPGAMARFMQESGIDPMDYDADKKVEYKPKTYTVDDKEVELDQVIAGIRDSDSFSDTIDIVSNKWDETSKQEILKDPKILEYINNHVAEGYYGQITEVMDQQRMLGNLEGIPDIVAYQRIGDAMQAQGLFNKQETPAAATEEPVTPAPKAEPKPVEDPKLNDRRRAASPTKSSPSAKKQDYNPLDMSDEDFEKASGGQFM